MSASLRTTVATTIAEIQRANAADIIFLSAVVYFVFISLLFTLLLFPTAITRLGGTEFVDSLAP